MKRLLIVGANGFLGGWLLRARDPRFETIGVSRPDCEITSRESVCSAFESVRPEVVILCAAIADIDRCEREPELARRVNIDGTRNVAQECAQTGTRLLFTSSGAVFDGTADSYYESDAPTPISVYGRTKAEAELTIRDVLPSAAIARLSLVLGSSTNQETNSLLDKLRASFAKGTPVFAPAEEYRNAIDAGTLTQWLLDLAASDAASGIFHLGASDAVSRYEITCQLAEAMGYSPSLVLPSAQSPDRAPRGRRQMLVPGQIQQYSRVAIPPSRETIERCVHASV